MESIQKKLSRVRSPRVHITYDVEIGDAIVQRELPLIVGILADLSGKPQEALPPIKERAFVFIDRDNFDDVMAGSQVRLAYSVANVISGEEGATTNLELLFHSIEDFSPLSLVKQIPITSTVYASRCRIRDFMAKLDGNDPLDGILDEILGDEAKQTELIGVYEGAEDMSAVEPNELITRMLTEGRMALDDSQKPYALELIGEFALSILKDAGENAAPVASDRMSDRISLIDNQLTQQINLVMHDGAFQRLEATWRGLHFLVMNTETGSHLKLRLFNVSKEDLLKDLQKAVEFDQSSLFKKVYEEEFGTYGGDPFSFLVGDYEFGRHPADVELLEKISGVAASAHAPFISSAYSKLFDMEDFFSLAQPRDLTKIFDSAELIKWRSFRESEDSRYVTLTLPKVLLRLPYGPETVAAEGFDYVEDVDGTDAKKYLWGNPAYILGQRITNAFSLHGWLAAIRGVEGGGLVEGLPTHTFKTTAGDIKLTCPTQVSITDRREKELNDLGFMAILHCKGSDKAAFFGGQTTGLPQKYNTDAANANARISTMLPYVLNASRFAHYIKVIMRDKIGSFQTKENASDYLNNWIGNYVLVDDSAPQEMKASYPLRDSRIDVTDVPGKPGSYRAVVFLRPHFQLEELTTSIRLVAELP
ncbi:type VI secretion system contractile sheath large subunit [Thalassomonas actiniarum]|uniref:Type VI secretion system contractile sheath large subunit n=1 Tax=Thalassomonas actiniarum TaxID=485447 RepID=A0AAE9YKY0_9GAMM|nr:type VI secretion system contractile sheath large subunit [Thalassomonas actiniarum]WDD96573.1 type VI secretion system contractile sheath large subunit [Thalassomonas actiniarum]